MLSRLWGGKSKSPVPAVTNANELKLDQTSSTTTSLSQQGSPISIDSPFPACELNLQDHPRCNGNKGYPRDISCVHYHSQSALLFVGTSRGSVITYGQGFQMEYELLPVVEAHGARSEAEYGADTVYNGKPFLVACFQSLGSDSLVVALRCGVLLLLDVYSMEVTACMSAKDLRSYSGVQTGAGAAPPRLSALHADAAGGKSYVYVGMTSGDVLILDASAGAFRAVDFRAATGVQEGTQVTAIAVCPHDERYLAIAYDRPLGSISGNASVVIHDVRTNKPYRRYQLACPTKSMVWSLFEKETYLIAALRGAPQGNEYDDGPSQTPAAPPGAGTSHASTEQVIGGADCVVVLELDRHYATVAWNTSGEVADTGDYEYDDGQEGDVEDGGAGGVEIKDMTWLPAQREGDTSYGCLAVLLQGYTQGIGIDGEYGLGRSRRSELETYCKQRNAIILLELVPTGNAPNAPLVLQELLGVPQFPGEQTIACLVVPAVAHGDTPSPALLLVTQEIPDNTGSSGGSVRLNGSVGSMSAGGEDGDNDFHAQAKKYLRFLACPAAPLNSWALEVGTLPDPRKLSEISVYPAGGVGYSGCSVSITSDVTCLQSMLVGSRSISDLSLSNALASKMAGPAIVAEGAVDPSSLEESTLHLAACNRTGSKNANDLVFLGHACGSVSVWAVAYPHFSDTIRASVWHNAWTHIGKYAIEAEIASSQQSTKLRAGRHVTCLVYDDDRGLVAWSNACGHVSVWGVGADMQMRQVFSYRLGANEQVTSLLLLPSTSAPRSAMLIVGTQEGKLYYSDYVSSSVSSSSAAAATVDAGANPGSDMDADDSDGEVRTDGSAAALQQLLGLAQMRPAGGILELWLGVRAVAGRLAPAIYLILESGQCAILQISESTPAAPLLLAAYSSNPLLETTTPAAGSPVPPPNARHGGYQAYDVLAEAQWERHNGVTSDNVRAIGLYDAGGGAISAQSLPQYFLAVYGRCVVTYDLHTFTTIDTKSTSYGFDGKAPMPSRITKQRISQSLIVCAFAPNLPSNVCKCVGISSPASKAGSPIGHASLCLHLIFANTSGSAGVVSLARCFIFNQAFTGDGPATAVGSITPSSMIDLASRHADEGSWVNDHSPPCLVARVAAQSNGDMYVHSQSGSLLAQLTIAGSNFSIESKIGSTSGGAQSVFTSIDKAENSRRSNAALSSLKVAPLSAASALACQLKTGREARLAKVAQKIQKRRTSMLPSFSTAPTNLSEVYVKTRAAATVAYSLDEEDEEDEEDGDDNSKAKHAKGATAGVASSMREAKEAMQKRGEMLSLLAAKGEAFQNETDDFRAAAKAKRKQLEAKSKRWGF